MYSYPYYISPKKAVRSHMPGMGFFNLQTLE
jgi:hypothetical protein